MELTLILIILSSVLPITELRGALPLAVNYSLTNNLPILPIFFLIILLNILVIFFIFFFLDFLHLKFLKIGLYEKLFNFNIKRIRKRADKVEERIPSYGYLALTLFVAVPLPITGAWTGCLIAWLLGLERAKSIGAIALGVFIAGIIVLFASLGILNLFY